MGFGFGFGFGLGLGFGFGFGFGLGHSWWSSGGRRGGSAPMLLPPSSSEHARATWARVAKSKRLVTRSSAAAYLDRVGVGVTVTVKLRV